MPQLSEEARAVRLAEGSGLLEQTEWLTQTEFAGADPSERLAEEWFAVPSRSKPGSFHAVQLDVRARVVRCDCEAGRFGKPCAHAGAAILIFRRLQAQYAQQQADKEVSEFGRGSYEWTRRNNPYEYVPWPSDDDFWE